jgi:hypothetical protein
MACGREGRERIEKSENKKAKEKPEIKTGQGDEIPPPIC